MLDMYAAVLEEMGHRPVRRIRVDPKPETVIAAGAEAVVLDLEAQADSLAGLRVIEELREDPATEKVPIILCTAATEEVRPLMPRLEELQVPVLIKPFAIDQLRDVIGQVLPAALKPKGS